MRFQSLVRYFYDKFSTKKKFEAQVLMSAYKNRFLDSDGYGELVVKDLMRFANMDRPTNVGELNAQQLAFIEGKRAVIHYIFDMLNIVEIDMLDQKRGAKKS